VNWFIHPVEHRLRAGWRLLLHTLMTLFFTLVIGAALLVLSSALRRLSFNPAGGEFVSPVLLLISQISFAAGVTLSTFIARRWLDRRSFVSLGLSFSWDAILDLVLGILIAGVMMGFIFFLEWMLGWLTITGFGWKDEGLSLLISKSLVTGLLFVLVGWTEELLSRGYHLQNLSDGLNRFWGIVLSSLIFAVLHLSNPGFSIPALLGLFLSGLFFCYAVFQSRGLWLPIGLHIGWNFFEGTVFGFQVSGIEDFPRFLVQTVSGPEILTGGGFGPEAGLILLPGLAVGVGLVWLWSQRKRKLEAVWEEKV
jgi:membrane protease YdiL (CAAX protease family)